MRVVARSYRDQLLDIRDEYKQSGQPWPASATDIATWAFNNGHIRAHSGSVIKQYAREIARAFREDYHTDPQGRQVRTMHAAPVRVDGNQKMLWDDIRTTGHDHMERALKLRRHQIVGDCQQLKRDQDSYNDNNVHGAVIQLSFNFERDLQELDTLEEYSRVRPTKKPR